MRSSPPETAGETILHVTHLVGLVEDALPRFRREPRMFGAPQDLGHRPGGQIESLRDLLDGHSHESDFRGTKGYFGLLFPDNRG